MPKTVHTYLHAMSAVSRFWGLLVVVVFFLFKPSGAQPSPMLTTPELADRWKVSIGHLNNDRSAGRGVPFLRLSAGAGGGSIRYRLSDVEAYEAASLVSTTGNAAA